MNVQRFFVLSILCFCIIVIIKLTLKMNQERVIDHSNALVDKSWKTSREKFNFYESFYLVTCFFAEDKLLCRRFPAFKVAGTVYTE